MKDKVRDTFNDWGTDARADNMADEHWPMVKQASDLVSPTSGDYLEIGVGKATRSVIWQRTSLPVAAVWGWTSAAKWSSWLLNGALI